MLLQYLRKKNTKKIAGIHFHLKCHWLSMVVSSNPWSFGNIVEIVNWEEKFENSNGFFFYSYIHIQVTVKYTTLLFLFLKWCPFRFVNRQKNRVNFNFFTFFVIELSFNSLGWMCCVKKKMKFEFFALRRISKTLQLRSSYISLLSFTTSTHRYCVLCYWVFWRK